MIKNVAGYDLAKLFAGSFGTLGAIIEVAVRLHPLPPSTATAIGRTGDAAMLAEAAAVLTHAPLEHSGLDVRWEDGARRRCSPASAAPHRVPRRRTRPGCFAKPGSTPTWSRRTTGSGPRSATTSERDRARPTRWCAWPRCRRDLPALLEAATRHSALLVGRAAARPLLADGWRTPTPCRARARMTSAGSRARVVLDAPAEVRERVEPWGDARRGGARADGRVKDGFDPAGACAPGVLWR